MPDSSLAPFSSAFPQTYPQILGETRSKHWPWSPSAVHRGGRWGKAPRGRCAQRALWITLRTIG